MTLENAIGQLFRQSWVTLFKPFTSAHLGDIGNWTGFRTFLLFFHFFEISFISGIVVETANCNVFRWFIGASPPCMAFHQFIALGLCESN